jgi:hypothetical protein
VIAAILAGAGWILYVDRNLSFFGDDWTFVVDARHNWSAVLMSSHNGHWTLVHGLLYETLFVTVGLHSYVPYLVLMLAAHAATVTLLFFLIRRRSGDLLAAGAAAILLLYGAAAEDLAWAFQVDFIAPVALGLAALLLLDAPGAGPRRVGAAAVLLTLGIATSGIGLVMLAAVAAEVAIDPARRRCLTALAPPAAVFTAWYLLVARRAGAAPDLSAASLLTLPDFVRRGLAPATAAVFGYIGQSNRYSTLIALLTAAAIAAAWVRRGRVGSRAAGPVIALVFEFVLIGLTRGQLGINQGASSRYLYVAAVLILLVLADALADFPARWPVVAPLAALMLVSVWFNSHQLASFAAYRTGFATAQAAELQTFEAYRGDPGITPDAVIDPLLVPISPREYYDASTAWGSPVQPVSTQDVGRLDAGAVDRALATLFANGLAPGNAPSPLGACSAPVPLMVPPGTVVLAVPDANAVAVVHVAVIGPDGAAPSISLVMPATLTLGGDRLPAMWRVTVTGGSVCPLN